MDLNDIGAVAQMFYGTPKLQAVGVNDDGHLVDSQGNVVQTPFAEPGGFQKAVNPYARQISGINQQFALSGLQAQQANAIQRGIIGSQVDTQPYQNNPNLGAFGSPRSNDVPRSPLQGQGMYSSLLSQSAPEDYHSFTSGSPTIANVGNENLVGKERQAWISQIQNPRLEAGLVKQNAEAQGGLNTGLIGQTGSLNARIANTIANTGLNQAQYEQSMLPKTQALNTATVGNELNKATQVEPLSQKAAISELTAKLGRLPTENETQSFLAQQAKMSAMFGLSEQGLNQSTQRRQDLIANMNASQAPQVGTGDPFAVSVSDNGISTIPGINQAYINKMRLAMAQTGGAVPSSISSPSGYSMPAKPQAIPAGNYTPGIIGQGSPVSTSNTSDDYMVHAMNYEPTGFNPDLLVNPKTGRVVYKPTGADVTEQVRNNPALIHQIAQEQKKKQETEQLQQEKVIKAKHVLEMEEFGKKQDAIASQKPYGGLVGVGRDVLSSINNTLIGNAANAVGNATSDWHPYDAYQRGISALYNTGKSALIGQ